MKFYYTPTTIFAFTCTILLCYIVTNTKTKAEIRIQSLDRLFNPTVQNDMSAPLIPIKRGTRHVKHPAGDTRRRRKAAKNRHRHKKREHKKAKRLRLLRSNSQFLLDSDKNLSPKPKTLGLKWVVDIKRNLTSLTAGLQEVQQQLEQIKTQLQSKQADSTTQLNSRICPWGMLSGKKFNKCYSFHNSDRRSWYQAAASCRVVGSRLLRIRSAEETSYLLSRAPAWLSSGSAWLATTWTDGNRLYPCPSDGNSIWPSETSWGWGTRVDRLCFNQLVDKRNDNNPIKVHTDWLMSADSQAGACVALAVASTNWEALDCDRPAAYVCERDPVRQKDISQSALASESSPKISAKQDEEESIFWQSKRSFLEPIIAEEIGDYEDFTPKDPVKTIKGKQQPPQNKQGSSPFKIKPEEAR